MENTKTFEINNRGIIGKIIDNEFKKPQGIIKKTTYMGDKKEVIKYASPIAYAYEGKNQFMKYTLKEEKRRILSGIEEEQSRNAAKSLLNTQKKKMLNRLYYYAWVYYYDMTVDVYKNSEAITITLIHKNIKRYYQKHLRDVKDYEDVLFFLHETRKFTFCKLTGALKKRAKMYLEQEKYYEEKVISNSGKIELQEVLDYEMYENNKDHFIELETMPISDEKWVRKKYLEFKERKEILQANLTDTDMHSDDTRNWKVEDLYKRNDMKATYMCLGKTKMQADLRAIKNIKELLESNIKQWGEQDKWVTLTYADEYSNHSTNREQVKKDLQALMTKLGRRFNRKIEYIAVLEIQHARFEKYGTKHWHLHIALFNCPYLNVRELGKKLKNYNLMLETESDPKEIKKLEKKAKVTQKEISKFWKYGTIDIESLKDSNLATYLSKYVGKDFAYREFDPRFSAGHRYFRSNGLKKPQKFLNSAANRFDIFDENWYFENCARYLTIDSEVEAEKTTYTANFKDLDENAEKNIKNKTKISFKTINKFVSLLNTALDFEKDTLTIAEKNGILDVINFLRENKYVFLKKYLKEPLYYLKHNLILELKKRVGYRRSIE